MLHRRPCLLSCCPRERWQGLRRPSADELRRKVEVRLAAYVDAIEHPTQATRDVKSETDG
ncbi:hypothetical protein PF005_g20492 [Phytophthora fragariae]|uniref:Uncharacterized protein n=1 Tax=Phytophthora fragariae TaxID=53985 RepID=A0A6A4CIN0_9STRA|nr:hypothetical protein PF011_g26540 [Phytophthora fragariae]KAE9086691.1 hypothetical protein PF010_g19992 [Phytophthora fragariae]KAE9114438.1 hypothetical protein PF006_g19522 [Phytophthora fragariae]KAE9187331.1 hypothetical protein PF005_g20492 [Phytophthora fragariae]KAE9199542.1 hypothetical protein PF004_g19244 [Phytophthora fragariae]